MRQAVVLASVNRAAVVVLQAQRPAHLPIGSLVTSAARVWVFLVGGALAYDVLALRTEMETLSAWCRRHPKTTLIVGGYLLAHLTGHPAVMHRFDPLHLAARFIGGRGVLPG